MAGYLIVFLGGGIGAALRYGVNRAALLLFGTGYPYGTLAVNLIGGLAIGALAQLFLGREVADGGARLFLTTGLLGGFTTFSAFSLELALMWQRGAYATAAGYAAASVLLSVLALFTGMSLVRAFS